MIDASQRILSVNSQVQGEAAKEGWGIKSCHEGTLRIRNKNSSKRT
jgi:hypothetical protein